MLSQFSLSSSAGLFNYKNSVGPDFQTKSFRLARHFQRPTNECIEKQVMFIHCFPLKFGHI